MVGEGGGFVFASKYIPTIAGSSRPRSDVSPPPKESEDGCRATESLSATSTQEELPPAVQPAEQTARMALTSSSSTKKMNLFALQNVAEISRTFAIF